MHDDLKRIEAFVKGGFDRRDTRGLAFFACAATDLWEVIELPKPVRSCLVINHAPAVGQLESMVQEHEPIGVLLADKQRGQLYVFELGRLERMAAAVQVIVVSDDPVAASWAGLAGADRAAVVRPEASIDTRPAGWRSSRARRRSFGR